MYIQMLIRPYTRSSSSLIPRLPDLFNALVNVEKTEEPLDEATTSYYMYYCVHMGEST